MFNSLEFIAALLIILPLSSFSQNDATFEEAIDFVDRNLKSYYESTRSNGYIRSWHDGSLSVVDNYQVKYEYLHYNGDIYEKTYELQEQSPGHIYLKVSVFFDLKNITEIKAGDGFVKLKGNSANAFRVVEKLGHVSSSHLTLSNFIEYTLMPQPLKELEGTDYHLVEYIRFYGGEEMAQRIKKALDHARKLAGAEDEKF